METLGSRARSGMVALLLVAITFASLTRAAIPSAAASNHDAAYVSRMVQVFLGRPSTTAEVTQTTSVSMTTVEGRSRLVSNLVLSPHWLEKTVEQLYLSTLGRRGDRGGVAYWVDILRSGRRSVAEVTASFYASPEFFTRTGQSSLGTWTDSLYDRLLVRSADPNGRRYWVSAALDHGRGAVAYAFFQSEESRRSRVTEGYATFLRRPPDKSGLAYWAGHLLVHEDLSLHVSLATSAESYGPLEPGQVVTPPPPPLLVERLAHNGTTTKVLTVRSSDWSSRTAEVIGWERTAVGWKQDFGPWSAHLGSRGFGATTSRREGDGTTPVGRYGFGIGFGLVGNPGYVLGWFVVGPVDYWTSDAGRSDYNSHQRGPADPTYAPWSSFEHLIDHPVAYRYAASINFNNPATGPFGSAIFLHVSTGGPTAGCVSLPQDQLLVALRWIDADTRIVMGPDSVIRGL